MRDGKPEVPGLGVLSPEGRQDLHLVPNFDSQLQSCFKQPEQLEVLGLGDVLPLGGLHDLHHGAVRAVQEESRDTRQESFVSLDSWLRFVVQPFLRGFYSTTTPLFLD